MCVVRVINFLNSVKVKQTVIIFLCLLLVATSVLSGEILTKEPYSDTVLKSDPHHEVPIFSNYSKRLSQSGQLSDTVKVEDFDRVAFVCL